MIFIVMGVSGSGKSTVGKAIGNKFGWKFYEGDEYHTAENVEKMKNGIPLNDNDRLPWLLCLRYIIEQAIEKKENIVISCSALKETYREILKVNNEVTFIYLKGSFDLISKRMEERKDHFFKPAMLKSQFDTLEEPDYAVEIDISGSTQKMIDDAIAKIKTEEL
ncbi:MAG: gluconokinase [Ignavibacteriaceae bacterium]